ncbi:MAG: 2-hydroxyacid dehydrogenase [Candidatus Pacebacteria bacterium]|nr:2-hydroxyacid dehydrogenase [Candidatus Paceibacterota bacterium]
MQKLLYVYEERIPQDLQTLVLSYFPKDEFEVKTITYLTSPEEQARKLGWAEVVFFAPGRFLPDNILESARSVKLMQLWSSGYDKFNVAGAKKFGIPVANNGGSNAQSVAEHAVLLMLAVYKWLPDSHRRTVTGTWAGNNHGLDMFTLRGKKVGVIGFGNIGQGVARILKGFGAQVLYYDIKQAAPEKENELGAAFLTLSELLNQSDIVTLHLHSNDNTKNIISAEAFSQMRKGSVLINASRAALVDQQALFTALTDGTLHGAGLDVYPEEPTKTGDPILTLPNVVATPHMAGSTRDAYIQSLNNALENFRRVEHGEMPHWLLP